MLKDPNFNVADLTLRNMENGMSFSEYFFTSPIDGREIPTVVGVTIPTHPKWSDRSQKEPVRMMCAAKHSTGIFLGYPLDDAIQMFSSSEVLSDMADFDLSTGMWYSIDEYRESLHRCDWEDRSPLRSGKPRPNHNAMTTAYGVADNITQVLKHYRKVVSHPDYDVAIHIRYLDKEGKSGMRWHKHGKYLGSFKKKQEYMHDEQGLGDLIQFHFYVIKN